MSRLLDRWVARIVTLVVLSLAPAGVSAAQPGTPARANATTVIAELSNRMPGTFDIYPSDPCAGVWDVQGLAGEITMTITVMRYRNIPMVRVTGAARESVNGMAVRIDPRSIRTSAGLNMILRCGADRAVVKVMLPIANQYLMLNARRGATKAPVAKVPANSSGGHVSPIVRVVDGDIEYVDANGVSRWLSSRGDSREPVLSPDGRTVAFIRTSRMPVAEGKAVPTTLWVANITPRSNTSRRLLASTPDQDPKRNLASFGNPHFSLDGGFVYIDADAWVTSPAVHEVNIGTGEARYVTDGAVLGVIRNGPHRGNLIVSQHRYRKAPEGGSYDPVSLVRPDGTAMLVIPGTDGNGDADALVAAWLKRNGWQAW